MTNLINLFFYMAIKSITHYTDIEEHFTPKKTLHRKFGRLRHFSGNASHGVFYLWLIRIAFFCTSPCYLRFEISNTSVWFLHINVVTFTSVSSGAYFQLRIISEPFRSYSMSIIGCMSKNSVKK